jgi:sugar diacid utilization regulator
VKSIKQLLDWGVPSQLTLLAPGDPDRLVEHVVAIDNLDQIRDLDSGAFVCVLRTCAEGATGYELDVAIRYAVSRELAGFLLMGRSTVPVTARQLATRAGLTIVGCGPEHDLAELLRSVDRILSGGEGAVLARAAQAIARLREVEETFNDDEIVREVSAALATTVRLDWEGTEEPNAEAVVVGGQAIAWLVADDREDLAVRIVLPALAGSVARAYEHGIALEQARGELLSALIEADEPERLECAALARDGGVSIDGYHLVLSIRGQGRPAIFTHSGSRRWQLLALVFARRYLGGFDRWTVGSSNNEVMFVVSDASADALSLSQVRELAVQLIAVLHREFRELDAFGGISLVGTGAAGLCSSAAEARAASSSASSSGVPGRVEEMDASGIGRMLGLIYASPTSRRAMNDLLAPMDALPIRQQETMLETLVAFLDAQGSNQRAARTLHLHPNAVAYRMAKVREIFTRELEDPDQRLALHVACRVRLLHRN